MKRKSLLFALLVALFMPWAAQAQETVEIGTDGGTTTNNYLPGYTLYDNTLSEQIYTAEEVTMAGTISSIAFYNGGSTKSPTVTLYMVNTDKEAFSSTSDWLSVTSDDLVFEGPVTFTSDEWTTITLDTPFEYDGTSNLGLVAHIHMSQYSSGLSCRVFTSTSNCSMYKYRDYTVFDPTNPNVDGTRLGVKNQIKLEITPSTGVVCNKPETFEASNVTSNSADLTWTGGSGLYNIELNGTVIEESYEGYTFNLADLSPATNYTVRLQSVCDDATSGWKTVSFTTECDVITTLPWSENFDGYTGVTGATAPSTYPNDVMPNCWQFLNRSNSTSSYPQVFISSNSGYPVSGNCLFFKSSSTTPLYAILPEFAQDIANLQLTFTYRNESTTAYNGTLIVGYMTDPTDATTFETVLTCDRTTTMTEMEAAFVGAPTGSYIAFMYQGGSSNNYYLSIDNVVVEPAPTCLKPTDLAQTHTNHSATLSWTAGSADQNAWQIAYSTSSFNPNAADFDLTTVEVIDVEDNPYTFDKTLEANTHYYMYVRGNCGDEDYSKWVGIDFTTGAAAPSPTITTVDEITPVSAVLRWTSAGGDFLESYDIYYSQTSGTPTDESEIQYTGIGADYTSYILQNLTEGSWYVNIRAYHGETDGYSSWASYYGYSFQVPEACPEPTGLTASDPTPNSITLTWTEGAEWQYAWKVAYSTDPEFNPEEMDPETFVEVFGQQGPTITCTVTGLDPETTYYFRVLGNCNSPYGDSDWTNAVSATTLVACPLPTDLVATPASTSAILTWTGYSDSYTVQYRTSGGYDFELIEGFEGGSMPAGWTTTGSYWSITSGTGHNNYTGSANGNFNAGCNISSYSGSDILVTPSMNLSTVTSATLDFNFWNTNWGGDINTLNVYYRVNGGDWNLLYTNDSETNGWETVPTITLEGLAADYQIGFECQANYSYGMGIDDITIIAGENHEPGEWITYNENVTSTTATIEGLEFGTKYDAQVKANCGEEYCDYVTFTTNALKTFTTEGDWSVADNWTPAGVPTIEDVVSIEAAATITDIAYANEITINGGSITIADGGQLVHNNTGVAATVKKTILGVGEADWNADNNGGYYFIANPLTSSVYPEEAGLITEDGNYDLYDWAAAYELEWRYYKDAQFSLCYYNTPAYLYANMNEVELAFNGTVRSSENRVSAPVYVSNGEFGTWNLIGNPFVCNAYLVDNAGAALPYYKMNEAGDSYDAVTGEAIAPVTGIFYEAPAGGSVYFTREAPAKSGSLNMVVSQGRGVVDNAIIRFGEGQQMSKFSFRENSSKIYVPVEGKDYAIVNANNEGEMPVSFKAENNGSYTLSFYAEEVSFSYLHLIDNMTGNDVNLLETPSYSFEAKTTDYANRFRLVFVCGDVNEDNNFAFYSNGSFVINNEGNATVQVIDVTGRILSSETINGCANVNMNAAAGVYMLRLINGDNVKVQKVVVR